MVARLPRATGEYLDLMPECSTKLSEELEHRYHSARYSADYRVEKWAVQATRFLRDQPLVAGALGIAVGALPGGLMPASDRERELARRAVDCDSGRTAIDRSDEILDSAREAAGSRKEKAGETARKKIEEVKKSAVPEA